jgi:hypothetical protein
LSRPEEEWLSRCSHHTAQRTVPFWWFWECSDTGTPSTPRLPTFGPGPSPIAVPTSATGEAGLTSRRDRSFISTPSSPLQFHVFSFLVQAPHFYSQARHEYHPPSLRVSHRTITLVRLSIDPATASSLLFSSDVIQSQELNAGVFLQFLSSHRINYQLQFRTALYNVSTHPPPIFCSHTKPKHFFSYFLVLTSLP